MTGTPGISREELRALIERGEPFHLFEVLAEPYYRRHHLPGALLMPPTAIEQTVKEAAPDLTDPVVLYCWDEH